MNIEDKQLSEDVAHVVRGMPDSVVLGLLRERHLDAIRDRKTSINILRRRLLESVFMDMARQQGLYGPGMIDVEPCVPAGAYDTTRDCRPRFVDDHINVR